MGIEFKGFDELNRRLKEISSRAEQLSGTYRIDEILSSQFMRKHTRFSSFTEMLNASKWKGSTAEQFEAIPDAEWDAYVRQIAKFGSWKEMLSKAAEEYAARKLGLG